ncbi:hypothetical protein BO71DRAFT_419279 [Aspergillus ellipticus CBS 707.79]|uniref:DUF7600 domain-containing protein n=1 Tax=Aspergillus ellipticus CBS 707.79 TaxID=1448320 RepID=A0A319DAX6_9EURO|nr:hypothetical protein BO71DRAFT_419279 [Aspergillus ellipticus CBS 707.79]
MSNIYCPLCGVILLPDPYRDDEPAPPPTRVRPWYAEVRGIYATNPMVDDVTITGLGILRLRSTLCAPMYSDASYVEVGLEALEEWKICRPSETRWCFAFHNSCWKLLLLRLGHGRGNCIPDETAIAESVFHQLYCTPCLEFSWFQFGHDYGGASRKIPPTSTAGALFNGLSTELKFEICSYLSFVELLTMRLVCRDLALLARVDTLPQSYWRSRFLLGQEADFLFLSPTAPRDWSRVFFGSRVSRIRQLLEPIAALVELEAVWRSGPYGSIAHPAQGQGSHFEPIDEESGTPHQVLEIEHDHLPPPSSQSLSRIGISIVHIGAQSFVAGINLFPSRECNSIGYSVGYHNPASEKWIEIPSTSHLKAFGVAFCCDGLTGIQFIFTNSDPSGWFGVSKGNGIAQGILEIPESFNRYYLLASLDRFKIPGPSWKPPFRDATRSSRPSRAFAPLNNIDFGGSRGSLLGSLTRLAFHIEKSVLFGSSGGCEISFFVDGSQGERINRIATLEDNSRCHREIDLVGLEVSTNNRRSAIFTPLRYRLKPTVESMSISLPHNTITGFVATETMRSKTQTSQTHFIQFGIQSQSCGEQPATPDISDLEPHQIPDHEIQYDQKFAHFIDGARADNYQTYASLNNVRRIQASTGIQGRSRSSDRITGLKIDYYNHPSPNVVGQRMNELDDGFEISPDEEIQSLTIWMAPMGYSSECPGMQVAQVAAIHIVTTRSRSVTLRPPGLPSLPSQSPPHQYQSAFGERLTAISWILNSSSDCIRAVASKSQRRRAQTLVPEQEPPFDQVRKLDFEILNVDGCREPLVTVEAYFGDRSFIGVVFVYASGARAGIGEFDTETRQVVHLPRDTRIVGLSAAATEHDLTEIEFEFEQNEQPQCQKLGLSVSSPHDLDSPLAYGWRDRWRKDRTSAESSQLLSTYRRVYRPPTESRPVGIYVGCRYFSHFGALYGPHISQ